MKDNGIIKQYDTGATRDTDEGKNDYEGFLNPLVIKTFGDYMSKHRKQSDGKLRASDNWQKGINQEDYMKSLWRHLMDLWLFHRGYSGRDTITDALCGIMFNAQGYLLEHLKKTYDPNRIKKTRMRGVEQNLRILPPHQADERCQTGRSK